jgi:hypothetical protein
MRDTGHFPHALAQRRHLARGVGARVGGASIAVLGPTVATSSPAIDQILGSPDRMIRTRVLDGELT